MPKAPGCQPCGDAINAPRTLWFGVAVGQKIQGACRGHLAYVIERLLIREDINEVTVHLLGQTTEENNDEVTPLDT